MFAVRRLLRHLRVGCCRGGLEVIDKDVSLPRCVSAACNGVSKKGGMSRIIDIGRDRVARM